MSEAVGESRLWKIKELVMSKNFPPLVESAAWQANKPFTEGLLRAVATDTALLDLVDLTGERGMDAALRTLSEPPTGEALDLTITAAVAAYTPEETP